MKWLVCASIYVLLFGMLNSNKLYLLAFFFIFKLLYGLYFICKCKHTLRISRHSPILFYIWNNSKLLCSGMQEYRKGPQCKYVCACECSNSYLKSLSQLNEDKVHVGPPRDKGKIYSNDSGQLLFFILILPASGGGSF